MSGLFKSPKAPPPPDYKGAAQATAEGNLELARSTAAANRVNQITPFGSWTYSHSGNDPDAGWSITQSLSPAEQAKLDLSNALETQLMGSAYGMLPAIQSSLQGAGQLDESRLAQMPIQGEDVVAAIMSRLQPQIEQDRASLATRLANQGLMQGSQGYNDAQTLQNQQENDLRIQAALQGIGTSLEARRQGVAEQTMMQDRPINMLNALQSGTQLNAPQFNAALPRQNQVAGPDMLQAAIGQANFDAQAAASHNAAIANNWNAVGNVAAAAFFF